MAGDDRRALVVERLRVVDGQLQLVVLLQRGVVEVGVRREVEVKGEALEFSGL